MKGGREVKGGLWVMRSVAYLPAGMCEAGSEALAVSPRCQQRCCKGQMGQGEVLLDKKNYGCTRIKISSPS